MWLKNKFINNIIKRQGGQKTSKKLREITLEKLGVDVGMYSYGSCFDKGFNIGGKVKIGRYCSFGPNVKYFGGNHPVDYVSMSPYFYQQSWADSVGNIKVEDIERNNLKVGDGCWIGCGAIILSKCHSIGNGSVIGAGSIVTKDVPPYSIVVGNPAKVIGYRFDEDTIKIIEESKWWEFKPEVLLNYYKYISEPKNFCEKIVGLKSKGDNTNDK